MTCSLEGDFTHRACTAELCHTMSPSSPSSSGSNSRQSSEGSQSCKEALSRALDSFSVLQVAHDCRMFRMNCIPEERGAFKERGEFIYTEYFVSIEKKIYVLWLLFFHVPAVLLDT